MTARVCIIGAGSSGIACAQVLAERGIEFDCFEIGSFVGGNWHYDNDNGLSSAYRSLHINSSREGSQFAAFPMPADVPTYPSHWKMAEYFDAFVDRFGLRERITFRTRVMAVRPASEGGYDVTIRGEDAGHAEERQDATRHYDHVLVASGHHWDARWPEPRFPGTFGGLELHSHDYRTPDIFVGKRVVVLGIGNSACDIAVDASRIATATYLSMRRGAYVIPKYLFGFPVDRLTESPLARAPLPVQSAAMAGMLRAAVGRMTDYGLPQPDHAVLHAHPTISDDLLSRLGHGDITAKPGIARFDGSTVHFTDGSAVQADVVVYCTGYRITFPFLDQDVVTAVDNHVALYRRVVAVDHPGLYFIGLVQPIGAIFPLAEQQAHWVADLITGVCALPPGDQMREQVAAFDERLRRRFVTSKRHTVEVDFHKYMAEIKRERARTRVPIGGVGGVGRRRTGAGRP